MYAALADNGKYAGIAAYQYENGMLIIRIPPAIYDGAASLTIIWARDERHAEKAIPCVILLRRRCKRRREQFAGHHS